MNESVVQASVRRTAMLHANRHVLCLLALTGINSLFLTVACQAVFRWVPWLGIYGWTRLIIGLLFTQVYLLSFWGAFRGGSMVVRLGAPFLAVVLAGFLAIGLLPRSYVEWEAQFAVLPVPLLMVYLVGLGLLLPIRWWSGKALLFPGEESPPGRPRQFRIDQIAAWIFLMGAVLGLTPLATAADLPHANLEMVLLGPSMVGFVAFLSIPLIRGVFARSRPVMWSACGLVLVLGVGVLVGGAECSLIWQRFARRWTWMDYSVWFSLIVSIHGIVGLELLGNFAVIRWLGGGFAVGNELVSARFTSFAPQPSNLMP